MTIDKKYYIITHQKMPWKLPFEHKLVGVEGFSPDLKEGISNEVISKLIDYETAFGSLRSLMAINNDIKDDPDSKSIFIGTYRLFLGKETNDNWISPIMQENKIISPEDLKNNWNEIISTEIPEGVDIMIPAPRLLPDTLLGQYARVHHLDDLLLAVGCAVRAGLLDPISVPYMLSSNTLIPYGNFAAKKNIRQEFNEKLWSCALDFYKNYYTPRVGYQRRVVDFAFERVASMAIIQMIVKNKLNCVSCRNIWVSNDGNYLPSV